MQIAIRSVRIELVGHVAVGLLHVLEHFRAPTAVDEQIDVTPVTIGQSDLVRDPVGRLFALIGIIAASIAGPLEREIGFTQQRVVFGKIQDIIADVADG